MNFKNCSMCGKKIGIIRKFMARSLDKDPVHMIPLQQFCSGKCAGIGLNSRLKKINQDALNVKEDLV